MHAHSSSPIAALHALRCAAAAHACAALGWCVCMPATLTAHASTHPVLSEGACNGWLRPMTGACGCCPCYMERTFCHWPATRLSCDQRGIIKCTLAGWLAGFAGCRARHDTVVMPHTTNVVTATFQMPDMQGVPGTACLSAVKPHACVHVGCYPTAECTHVCARAAAATHHPFAPQANGTGGCMCRRSCTLLPRACVCVRGWSSAEARRLVEDGELLPLL